MARINKGKSVSLLSVNNYLKQLDDIGGRIEKSSDYKTLSELIESAYKLLKDIDTKNNYSYLLLRDKVTTMEKKLEDIFLFDSNPSFNILDSRYVTKSAEEFLHEPIEEKIKYIVWFVRGRLLEHHENIEDKQIDFNTLHLTNDCKLACNIISLVCNRLNLPCKIIKLAAAYTEKSNIYNGNGFHYFCLIKDPIKDIDYIVDCTYRQFFTLSCNNLERLGVMGLNGCKPGIYMMENISRLNTAISILKNGYVVGNEINFKNYLDGFTLSYRNGLYYDNLRRVDYNVPYTIEQYLKFINGEDLLYNYESYDYLGEQEKPMSNKSLKFNK